MTSRLTIEPFDDFWLTCSLSHLFSILISKNSSYRNAAFMNSYIYQDRVFATRYNGSKLSGTAVPTLKLTYTNERGILGLFKKKREYRLKDAGRVLELARAAVDRGVPVFMAVDLFYWFNQAAKVEDIHTYHYSMMIGYDRNKEMYFFLDDNDRYRYTENGISERALKQAIDTEVLPAALYTLEPKKKIPDYRFSIAELEWNIDQIIASVANIDKERLWRPLEVSGPLFQITMKLIVDNITPIEQRQIGNLCLMDMLLCKGIINHSAYRLCRQTIEDLLAGWKKIKYLLIRYWISRSPKLALDSLRRLVDETVSQECRLWRKVLDAAR